VLLSILPQIVKLGAKESRRRDVRKGRRRRSCAKTKALVPEERAD